MNTIRSKGYSIRGLHLPTVGVSAGKPQAGAPPTMYDDASFVAKEVQVLVGEGKNVILICHSYGGTPTSQSTKGLSRAERQAEGKEGGIVRLAYMTAVVPALGASAQDVLADLPAQLPFNNVVSIKDRRNATEFVVVELFGFHVLIDLRLLQNLS